MMNNYDSFFKAIRRFDPTKGFKISTYIWASISHATQRRSYNLKYETEKRIVLKNEKLTIDTFLSFLANIKRKSSKEEYDVEQLKGAIGKLFENNIM